MKPTLVAWHRYGKEHGETDEFRVNSQDVIDASIRRRIEQARATDKSQWKWYQVSDELIVERPFLGEQDPKARRTIYYLPRRLWCIQEHYITTKLGPEWIWYIHIGSTTYEPRWQSWIFKDFFVDVLVQNDQITHSVLDLDDLATAHDIGLVDDTQMRTILRSTQELIDLLRHGKFPPPELRNRQEIIEELGWE